MTYIELPIIVFFILLIPWATSLAVIVAFIISEIVHKAHGDDEE